MSSLIVLRLLFVTNLKDFTVKINEFKHSKFISLFAHFNMLSSPV